MPIPTPDPTSLTLTDALTTSYDLVNVAADTWMILIGLVIGLAILGAIVKAISEKRMI